MWAWILGLALGIPAFFATLWLTEPVPPAGSGITKLASAKVADEASLLAALKAAGLRPSTYVQGHIDSVGRIDGARIEISGWAAELTSQGSPITIFAFGEGGLSTTETAGERPDVTSTLRLRSAAASNVAFRLSAPCMAGKGILVVAVTRSNVFTRLDAPVCP